MEKNPFFTIITVSFNSEKTIKETINSVLNQTETNFEYILIDGKSTDKTVEIIQSFVDQFKEKEISYQWISEKDKGIYNAFNKGIKLSKGNWISFLGSDDIYLKGALNTYKNHLEHTSKEIDFIHSKVQVENGKMFANPFKWKKFKRKMTIAHVGCFHNKEYFIKYGLFNETYKIAGDYELLLRAKDNLKTYWVNELTVIMGNQGISNHQIKKVYLETTKAKIETANSTIFIAKMEYYLWMLKYQAKKLLYAFTK